MQRTPTPDFRPPVSRQTRPFSGRLPSALALGALLAAGWIAALPGCSARDDEADVLIAVPPAQAGVRLYPDADYPDAKYPDGHLGPPRVQRGVIIFKDDDPRLVDFLARVPADDPPPPRRVEQARPDGIAVIDGNDADRDGYVEYYDSGNYVAELKPPGTVENSNAASPQPQLITLRGEVADLHVATFHEQPEPQLLAILEEPNGPKTLVSLGPDALVGPLEIRAGEIIGVAGQIGSINGRRVLVAHQLMIDGKTITVGPAAAFSR